MCFKHSKIDAFRHIYPIEKVWQWAKRSYSACNFEISDKSLRLSHITFVKFHLIITPVPRHFFYFNSHKNFMISALAYSDLLHFHCAFSIAKNSKSVVNRSCRFFVSPVGAFTASEWKMCIFFAVSFFRDIFFSTPWRKLPALFQCSVFLRHSFNGRLQAFCARLGGNDKSCMRFLRHERLSTRNNVLIEDMRKGGRVPAWKYLLFRT